jgi:hypothetical protein
MVGYALAWRIDPMPRTLLVALLAAITAIAATSARADVMSDEPEPCEGKRAGDRCVQESGAPGVCIAANAGRGRIHLYCGAPPAASRPDAGHAPPRSR